MATYMGKLWESQKSPSHISTDRADEQYGGLFYIRQKTLRHSNLALLNIIILDENNNAA
jgi:hypothetical protein